MTNNKFYEDRMLVWVFQPAMECPLSYVDLLVYSHLAYQSRYGNQPSQRRIAFCTGLCRKAIRSSLDRLTDYGLYDDCVRLNPDIFIKTKSNHPERPHWSQSIAGWRCLVPADGSPLTVPDAMVYSYLLAKVLQHFVPAEGWSHSYLAKCLRIERRTVQACILRLTKLALFRIVGGRWEVADCLVGVQCDWFKMREIKMQSAKIALGTFTPNPRFAPGETLP